MTKIDAIRTMLEIVTECEKHDSDGGGCKTCPFGHGKECMASSGNDIPLYWSIKDKLREATSE